MNNEMQTRWNEQFDSALRVHYGLTIDEARIRPLQLMAWRAMYPYEPEHAVWAFGALYELEPMQSVLEGIHDPA